MLIKEFSAGKLSWYPEIGIGYYPVIESPYDESYFLKYVAMAQTEMGQKLTQARVDLVNKYTHGTVLDIGIGCGSFVSSRPDTYGYDINPYAVNWLIDRKIYRHPFKGAEALTFWDSLEHIHDPTLMLQGAKEYVFISAPIYENAGHVLQSKHFRKDEHCWYWTSIGIRNFMHRFGFGCVEENYMETELGREDIGTFVFKRIT
jgi:hypothetical protein